MSSCKGEVQTGLPGRESPQVSEYVCGWVCVCLHLCVRVGVRVGCIGVGRSVGVCVHVCTWHGFVSWVCVPVCVRVQPGCRGLGMAEKGGSQARSSVGMGTAGLAAPERQEATGAALGQGFSLPGEAWG